MFIYHTDMLSNLPQVVTLTTGMKYIFWRVPEVSSFQPS